MPKEKYGFVYIWRDRKNNRYYIGSHWGHLDDGYICSSNWMRHSYKRRPDDFKRRILSIIRTDRKDLLTEEQRWLDLIKDEELGKGYYNFNKQVLHNAWWSDPERAKTIGERISNAPGRSEKLSKSLRGRKLTPEHIKNMSRSFKGRPGAWTGKKRSEEDRIKFSTSHIGKPLSEKTKQKLSIKMMGVNNPFHGKRHSKESKEKMSETLKLRVNGNGRIGFHWSDDMKKKMSESHKRRFINGAIPWNKKAA